MSHSKRPNKQEEIAADQLLIAGLQKHFASTALTLNGTSYTGPALVTLLQARISAINAAIAARATWQTAVTAQETELAGSQSIIGTLKKTLYAMFPDAASLADFGLTPHKKPVITPAERVEMVAKARRPAQRGTRWARTRRKPSREAPAAPA
jgi:hypothetical protein